MRQTPLTSALTGSLLALCACSGPDESNIFDGEGRAETTGPGSVGSTTSTVNTANNATSDTTTTTAGGPSTVASATTSAGSGGSGGSGGGSATGTGGGGPTSTSDGGAGGTAGATTSAGGATATGSGGTGGGTGGAGATGGGGGSGGSPCTPTDEVCDGRDNDCDNVVDNGNTCPTGCMGASFEGHNYMFCDSPPGMNGNGRPARSWQQAMQFCVNHGQLLVRVESEAENAFVYQSLNDSDGNGDVWMGATDQEDEDRWSWAAGTDPRDWIYFYDGNEHAAVDGAFADWRSGEPNNMGGEDCGVFEDQEDGTWLWDDRSCSTDFDRLVCEEPD